MESDLAVRDVLTRDYVGVSESDTVRGAVKLMREERTGSVLVVRGSDPVGIVTEWDVLGLVAEDDDPGSTTVEEVMSTPVITVPAETSLTDAAEAMASDNVRNLVVEANEDVVGVLTQRDVIAATAAHGGTASVGLDEELAAAGPTAPSTGNPRAAGDVADEYSRQGVCEACGSLADALWETNGQLVCTDCRSV